VHHFKYRFADQLPDTARKYLKIEGARNRAASSTKLTSKISRSSSKEQFENTEPLVVQATKAPFMKPIVGKTPSNKALYQSEGQDGSELPPKSAYARLISQIGKTPSADENTLNMLSSSVPSSLEMTTSLHLEEPTRRALDKPLRVPPKESEPEETTKHRFGLTAQRVVRAERPQNENAPRLALKAQPAATEQPHSAKPKTSSPVSQYVKSKPKDLIKLRSTTSMHPPGTFSRNASVSSLASSLGDDSKLDIRTLAQQLNSSDWAFRTSCFEIICKSYTAKCMSFETIDYKQKETVKILSFVVIGISDAHFRVAIAALSVIESLLKFPYTPSSVLDQLLPRLCIMMNQPASKTKAVVKDAVAAIITTIKLQFPPASLITCMLNTLSTPEYMGLPKIRNACPGFLAEISIEEWDAFLSKQSSNWN
jgi:hypothetical protein